ncbi:MAG: hypothetical protein WAN36_09555, partial [Calditrichia bacterium]
LEPLVPLELRGDADYEREGTHDANNIRTLFYNFGMVGDYPDDPINVDLSIFHSVEVPKGSNENYSDGITPFVLARVIQENGVPAYIMETGYRERQGTSPYFNRVMKFEPRPGYFQTEPAINEARSPALSNDPRTWPDEWIDKLEDPDDPGWSGSWNGYFGKVPNADQESYVVFDDQYYDAWNFFPDSRDAGEDPLERRRGLGLRVEQRGFQWSNPQARNVIFWHYDITNEGTTGYIDNIIFGLYMDSGVGGSGIGIDGIPESDDDNAFYDKDAGLNLVYTWDKNGNGVQGPTGYLGYSYLETPGNPFDGEDNDQDGITDEVRDGGPGQRLEGPDAIRSYVESHYNLTLFEAVYGPLEQRPAFREGVWFTGDEDLDWVAEFHDTGADGKFDTGDSGEGDGIPTSGERNFDKTDVDESDQIGLTGFKMNRIRAGQGNPSTTVDNIVFFDDGKEWPRRLYEFFTSDTSFDNPLVLNYNIGFLFASGPFQLPAGQTERFSLALGWGRDLRQLRETTRVVQQIYEANYTFAEPPPLPTVQAFPGDGYVTLTWDDKAERAFDPVTNRNDFQGYRIYRSTDPTFLDAQVLPGNTGQASLVNGLPLAQFDLIDDVEGYSVVTVDGVAYFLGENTGLRHTFKDTTVTNGQLYYYAVTAYDRGSDSLVIYPSENPISVSQTLRGGIILPTNVVSVRPNRAALGYVPAEASAVSHTAGTGSGTVQVEVVNPDLVPDDHTFEVFFLHPADSVHAESYGLIDATTGDTLFTTGSEFSGGKSGPTAAGLLPIVETPQRVSVNEDSSGFSEGSTTDMQLRVRYVETAQTLPRNLRRPGYPAPIDIYFSDTVVDTSLPISIFPAQPVKFRVIAHDPAGDRNLDFYFSDANGDRTLSSPKEEIQIVTYTDKSPNQPKLTWSVKIDTSETGPNVQPPAEGDVYHLELNTPFDNRDVFTFTTSGSFIDPSREKNEFADHPYVVPNPYVAAASFEPQRFAVSGRGERRIEFRGLPRHCTIRIYTITGELVKTIDHNGTLLQGFASWDLRTKDNLEVAPGLYIYHVDAKDVGSYIGKFAIIK